MNRSISALLLSLLGTSIAQAGLVTPTSYDMPNGYTGSYNYWDETYTGAGSTTTNGALLTGGLGDLTDGIIATQNWLPVEKPAGNGPYVGWKTIDPMITFNFAGLTAIDEILIYADDSDLGGVSSPASVDVLSIDILASGGPTTYSLNHTVADPGPSGAPFVISIPTVGLETDQIKLTINRRATWVFVSEVQFSGSPIPEPSSLIALLSVLFLSIPIVRRRRC